MLDDGCVVVYVKDTIRVQGDKGASKGDWRGAGRKSDGPDFYSNWKALGSDSRLWPKQEK